MARTDPTAAKCTCPTFDGEQAISVACPVHGTPIDTPDEASAVEPSAIDWDTLRRYVVVPKYNSPGSMPEQQGWQCLACKATWQSEEDEPVAHELYCSFAAVEALRERVVKLEAGARAATKERPTWQCCDPWFDGLLGGLLRRAEAAEARVAELGGDLKYSENKLWSSAGRNNNLAKELAAAEAREVELAGALERATRALQETADWLADEPEPRMGTIHGIWNDASVARTALAATPAKALERARAVEDVITAVRGFFPFIEGKTLGVSKLFIALTKLNALDKEEE
jgi:hypothetical protein